MRQPLLGSGTRAIVCDGPGRIDPLVAGAAAAASDTFSSETAAIWAARGLPRHVLLRLAPDGAASLIVRLELNGTPVPGVSATAPQVHPAAGATPPLPHTTARTHSTVRLAAAGALLC